MIFILETASLLSSTGQGRTCPTLRRELDSMSSQSNNRFDLFQKNVQPQPVALLGFNPTNTKYAHEKFFQTLIQSALVGNLFGYAF